MKTHPSFTHNGEKLLVSFGEYVGGALAVELICENGEPYTTLSVNVPEHNGILNTSGRFFAKTWSENSEVAKSALDSGLFIDKGLGVVCGFADARLWEFNGEAIGVESPKTATNW